MMNNIDSVIYHDHVIKCPECKTPGYLELYDKNNRPCKYDYLLYTHDKSIIKNRSIRYFKCEKCKTIFKIDWSGIVPIPLDNEKLDKFVDECEELKEK